MSQNDLQQLNSELELAEPQASVQAATDPDPKKKKILKFVDILLWVMIAVLAAALLVRVFFFTQITVSGESMMTTYESGDVVGVSKVRKPKRGDVVVFYKEAGTNKYLDVFSSGKSGDGNEHAKLIKRVVALAGDKLWVEFVDKDALGDRYKVVVETPDETLYENYYKRNGKLLDEQAFYVYGSLITGSDLGILADHVGKDNALTISDGCFFAMGDNRANSLDSRVHGEFPLAQLYGVVVKS